MLGEMLGHHRVEAKLGEGGMGVVYKALDTRLNRPVAIKVLPADSVSDAERKARFVQESAGGLGIESSQYRHDT